MMKQKGKKNKKSFSKNFACVHESVEEKDPLEKAKHHFETDFWECCWEQTPKTKKASGRIRWKIFLDHEEIEEKKGDLF